MYIEMIMLNIDCQIFDDLMDLTAVLKRNIPFIEPELLTEMKTHAKHVSVPTQTLILDEPHQKYESHRTLTGSNRNRWPQMYL